MNPLTNYITFLPILFAIINNAIAQTPEHSKAGDYYVKAQLSHDSSIYYFTQASNIYYKIFQSKSKYSFLALKSYIDCRNKLAKQYVETGESDTALLILNNSIELCEKNYLGSSDDLAEVYKNIGNAYYYKRELDKAMEYYQKSLTQLKLYVRPRGDYLAGIYNKIGNVYSAKSEYAKAVEQYQNAMDLLKKQSGRNDIDIIQTYNNLSSIYNDLNDYNKALNNADTALQLFTKRYGEEPIHLEKAKAYKNISYSNYLMEKYDAALEYCEKAIRIYSFLCNEKDPKLADVYNSYGVIYYKKGDFYEALKWHEEALRLYKNIFGEKHFSLAGSYGNIGLINDELGNYYVALDYISKALELYKKNYGEYNEYVADAYTNLACVYANKNENELSLEYQEKAFQVRKKLYSEKHPDIVNSYHNLGIAYIGLNDEKALEYLQKALVISSELSGDTTEIAASIYSSFGSIYMDEMNYEKAAEYFEKALVFKRKIFGEEHPVVAQIYNQLGHISIMEKNGSDAFDYYESGLCANIPSGNCDEYGEYKSLPPYFNYQDMSESLLGKSLCYFSTRDFASALLYLQFCDTLFDRARKGITKLNDKITLGEIISDFTESAVGLCYDMYKRTHEIDYLKQAFYFSEKNKASVLLEALAGQEAQRFAGIPDSVLQKETDLRKYISFYTKKIAEKPDSKDEADFKNLLFNYNRSYDNLINAFEKQYPDYYQLKYNRKTATAEDIQKQLDSGTAMISYFVCDSYLAIFTITNSEFKIKMQYIPSNFTNTIKQYRRAIINRNDNNNTYKEVGYYLYKMLFPQKLNKQITNLIIIPDNILSLVPFETLLTGHAGEKDFNELPYLVRKYNISYSYSATLFNRTFPKTPTKTIEVTQLNDWLAIAPVFSDKNTSGLTLASRNLMTQLDKFNKDTSLNRSYILTTGNYINPLPGTETEVKNIFSVFDSLNYKSKVQLNDVASEQYIKSGDLNNYRIVHFATHGFVNNQKPELSGILLAQIQDTAELQYNIENYISKEQNDGILYSGEIYNMRLNADLVVLSACETGLGKIKKGEGIIGLTRALLYAGAKNIIVSLWQVADESTSQLMIEFYRNFLEQQMQNPTYSLALSKAKLKLIDEGKFSHPFYWSPFILIGK